ncbi:hypothetical protein Hanom_Chr08g00726351 [Helianthus anomalus]
MYLTQQVARPSKEQSLVTHPPLTLHRSNFLHVVAVTFTGFPLVPSLKHTTVTQLINKNHHIYSCFLCVELC